MKKLNLLALAAASALGIMTASGTGCSDDTTETTDAGSQITDGGKNNKDGGSDGQDAGSGDAGMPECYDNPQNHFEIINACTNAQKVEKTVDVSAKLLPDGGLPPAP